MPVLQNPRHETFCQSIVKGLSQRDAYKSAGYSVSNVAAADASASRLLSDAKVRARIAELQSAAAEKTVATRAWIIDKLVQNVERAMEAEAVLDAEGKPTGEYKYNGSVANRALELLGKERGMFIDRKEVGGPGDFAAMSDADLDSFINRETQELLDLSKRAVKH